MIRHFTYNEYFETAKRSRIPLFPPFGQEWVGNGKILDFLLFCLGTRWENFCTKRGVDVSALLVRV
jgi:hypothetical protein